MSVGSGPFGQRLCARLRRGPPVEPRDEAVMAHRLIIVDGRIEGGLHECGQVLIPDDRVYL